MPPARGLAQGKPSHGKTADWDAATYHRVSEPQYRWGLEVLDRAGLEKATSVLDAGCGSGRLTAEIAGRIAAPAAPPSAGRRASREGTDSMLRGAAPQVASPGVAPRLVALDASRAMAREARQTLDAAGHTGVELLQADLAALPFQGAFDLIVSTAVFHWVLDQSALYRNLRAALRPGGRLVAQCGGGPNVQRLHDGAQALLHEAPFAKHAAAWREPWVFQSAAAAQELLLAAGFREARTWLEERPTILPDAATYRAFVERIVLRNHLALLPEALRGRFMDRIVDAATKDRPAFLLDYWRLNIEAVA